jgi:hypothetical protein
VATLDYRDLLINHLCLDATAGRNVPARLNWHEGLRVCGSRLPGIGCRVVRGFHRRGRPLSKVCLVRTDKPGYLRPVAGDDLREQRFIGGELIQLTAAEQLAEARAL